MKVLKPMLILEIHKIGTIVSLKNKNSCPSVMKLRPWVPLIYSWRICPNRDGFSLDATLLEHFYPLLEVSIFFLIYK